VTAPRVVYAIGDSLTGHESGERAPLFHLRDMLGVGVQLKAQGVGGEWSWHVRERVERDVLDMDPKPDTCIVLAGTNDLQNDVPPVLIIGNLEAIYHMLLEGSVHPIAVTIYPFGGHSTWTPAREAARQEVRAWMKTQLPVILPEVEVVDVEDVLGDLSDPGRPRIRAEYAEDFGIHVNSAGAAAVARALVEQTRGLGGR
jgi:lysophospholipase L1-like esterase